MKEPSSSSVSVVQTVWTSSAHLRHGKGSRCLAAISLSFFFFFLTVFCSTSVCVVLSTEVNTRKILKIGTKAEVISAQSLKPKQTTKKQCSLSHFTLPSALVVASNPRMLLTAIYWKSRLPATIAQCTEYQVSIVLQIYLKTETLSYLVKYNKIKASSMPV